MYKRHLLHSIAAALITLVTVVTALPQQPAASQLAKSDGGRRILGYFEAFNDPDEQKLRTFFEANVSAESLAARPVDARMQMHRDIRADLGRVEIARVISIADGAVSLAVRTPRGNLVAFNFILSPKPEEKIVSLGIEDTVPDDPGHASAPTVAQPGSVDDLIRAVDALVTDAVRVDAFSGVVYVARKDRPLYYKAFGLADKKTGRANQLDTLFNLGSINKVFTRIAIGQLIQAGTLSWNDKLGKFLPEYPNKDAASKVTIGQLVTMRSGIGDFFGDRFDAAAKDKFRTNGDFLAMFADKPLEFEPGTQQKYSNGGYVVLGAIIEKISGKSYYDYVRDIIFKPLGMTGTASYGNDEHPANTANGYTKHIGPQWTENTASRPWRGSAAGGGYSNVPDLVKFATALRDHKILNLGDQGRPVAEVHMLANGGAPGINTAVGIDETTGDIVIVLANYDPQAASSLASQITGWLQKIK